MDATILKVLRLSTEAANFRLVETISKPWSPRSQVTSPAWFCLTAFKSVEDPNGWGLSTSRHISAL